jgi:beta-galactosidase
MNKIIRTSESLIVNAKRKSEICVIFYPPYYATELERPVDDNCELRFVPSAIRRSAYFDGLLKVLQILNIDYDMINICGADSEILSNYKQVWVFCTDEMNAADQQRILKYTKDGGQSVIFPYLPDREMSQRPCTIIRDALKVSPSHLEAIDSPLIDILGFKDIKCANPQVTYSESSLAGSEIIARNINGAACGFIIAHGKGSLIHLGAWLGFDTEGHKPVYEAILKRSGANLRHANCDNANLIVRERFTNENSALLFAANYYNEDYEGKVTYHHPESGETISIPYSGDKMLWPRLYGVLSPVCLEVSEGLKILHSTSDILDVAVSNGDLEITIYGNRDLAGEMVFEGANISKLKSAAIGDNAVKTIHDKKRIVLSYSHIHKKEFILHVKID